MNLRKLRVVAGIAAVAALFAMATPASSLPRYTETFDCDNDGGAWYTHFLAPGATLTVALTSCAEMPVSIESGTVVLNGIDVTHQGGFYVPGDTSRITVTAGTSLWVPEFAQLTFPEAQVAADPKGILLDTETLTVGRNPAEFTVGTDAQIENHREVFLGGSKKCDIAAGQHVYATSKFAVTTKGTYTVRAVATDPTGGELAFHTDYYHPFNDMFAAIYPDHERPWNVTSKRVSGCNDDANDSLRSEDAIATSTGYVSSSYNPWMTMNLKPGKYVVVWTTYEPINNFDWSRGDNNGDSFDSYNQSITYEVWGPNGATLG